ncbi:hypothetical protein [Actinoplanes regularis]|uniref:hypothetical protein n=1 Tax=Actinoplanes regularis TaxID=52697 RepID=UPI0025533F47|nr:hypothetical protein [Actinoplanes regularis]
MGDGDGLPLRRSSARGRGRLPTSPGPGGQLLGYFYDVALRDVGLLIGALALARLATAVAPRGLGHRD